jgi:peptidoglycan/LPS O-acetylase OafA/YrhL
MNALATGATARTGKLLGLELLRFVAALAVLVWHYQHFSFNGSGLAVVRTQQPFYALLWPFYEFGWYGVQIFWGISGFIFFWRYRQQVADGSVGPWDFFVLRFSRLYPLHVLTLLLVAVLQLVYASGQGPYFVYQYNDRYHFLLQLLLASHWGAQVGYSFNAPIWSISVEVLVYFLFFIGIRLAGKTLLLHGLALILCIGLKLGGMSTPVTDCLGFFYGGGLAAIVFLRRCAAGAALCRRLAWLLVFAAPCAAVTWLPRMVVPEAAFYFLLAYIPLLLYCLAQPIAWPPLLARTIEVGGNLTYSSYLLHFPIQLLLILYFRRAGVQIPVYSSALFLFYMGAVVISAYLSYRHFELPTQRLLRRRLNQAVAA